MHKLILAYCSSSSLQLSFLKSRSEEKGAGRSHTGPTAAWGFITELSNLSCVAMETINHCHAGLFCQGADAFNCYNLSCESRAWFWALYLRWWLCPGSSASGRVELEPGQERSYINCHISGAGLAVVAQSPTSAPISMSYNGLHKLLSTSFILRASFPMVMCSTSMVLWPIGCISYAEFLHYQLHVSLSPFHSTHVQMGKWGFTPFTLPLYLKSFLLRSAQPQWHWWATVSPSPCCLS